MSEHSTDGGDSELHVTITWDVKIRGNPNSDRRAVFSEIAKALQSKGITISEVTGIVGSVEADIVAVEQYTADEESVQRAIASADVSRFYDELAKIISSMSQGSDTHTAEVKTELGHLRQAQIAARQGEKSRIIDHLKLASRVTLDVAKDVGAELIAMLIEHWLRFPRLET